MSEHHHTMTVEWDGGPFSPTYTPKCEAPAEALCRAEWSCDCERYSAHGVDDKGPWHEVYDYKSDGDVRHYGTPGGECGYLLFITESDCENELGGGRITFPISLSWTGDDYIWNVEESK